MNLRQWFALLFLFILYLLLGGVVFMLFESPEEEIRSKESSQLRNVIYDKLIMCERNVTNEVDLVGREEVWIQIAEQINQPILINNRPAPPRKWNFYNSFFVAVTVATTIGTVPSILSLLPSISTIGLRTYTATYRQSTAQVFIETSNISQLEAVHGFYNLLCVSIYKFGYGHLAPSSASGRLFCIFFALIGIPLNGILFATLGDFFGAKLVSRSSNRSLRRFSTFFVVLADVLLYFIPGLVIFLVIPAGLFAIVEGWNYIDSFYYAFISLTTIGFGDLVAGQNDVGRWTWAYRSFIIIWILLGLGYLIMVINIITKGLRSRSVIAPVVALERRMIARIRATKKTLSKDAVALRQLVNQIKVLKVKAVSRPARMGLFRTYSQPSLYYEENLMDIDTQKQVEATGSSEFSDSITNNYIDRDTTCNNGSFRRPPDGAEFNEDPVQLLTRLAEVLCDENEDDNLSGPDTSTFETVHTKDHKELDLESAFHRIRRSLHLSRNSCTGQSPCPPVSPQKETNNVNSLHRFATNRRIRHVSENHSHLILDCYGSMKGNQRFLPDDGMSIPNEFKRSFSERIPSNQIFSASSSQFTSASDRAQLKKDLLLTGTMCNSDSNNAQTDLPNVSVVEFSQMLDRVCVQVARENCSSRP